LKLLTKTAPETAPFFWGCATINDGALQPLFFVSPAAMPRCGFLCRMKRVQEVIKSLIRLRHLFGDIQIAQSPADVQVLVTHLARLADRRCR
jgi:hypothetical protein